MSEGLLGGVLGDEDEKPETEAPQALAGAEAFAAAVAARLSSSDRDVARDTSVFLKRQAELLELQTEHLRDEHALRLEHLAHQSHLLLGQRLGQLIRLAFQVVIALVVIVVGAGIVVMLHDAFTSHSVVIDTFNAPAGLAARGMTGTVVASDIFNELDRLQAATRGSDLAQQKRSLSNGWSNEVRVDVPETGVSLGEISQLLRARFGHDLHIGGSLVETAAGGLALTVSGGNLVPKTFTGGADDLDKLVVTAGEYVYSQFQPALWAHYLVEANRCSEAVPFIASRYDDGDDSSRASILADWAECRLRAAEPSPSATLVREVVGVYREAVELDPHYGYAYAAEESALVGLGDEEGAWRVGQAFRKAAGPELSRLAARGEPALFLSDIFLTHDLRAGLEGLIADAQANGGVGSVTNGSNTPYIAFVEARLHDRTAAELTVQALAASGAWASQIHAIRVLVDGELDEMAQAATEMQAPGSLPSVTRYNGVLTGYFCQLARVEDSAGHPDEVDAMLASPLAAHLVDCQRFRGDILDHRGDWAGAQQAYAQSVALAPDLPAGYYSWGVALARHGDLAGAIAKLRAANQRGPHWADPLKAWGDVLVKQGHRRDALSKYDEALEYAPNWAELKQARETAAKSEH